MVLSAYLEWPASESTDLSEPTSQSLSVRSPEADSACEPSPSSLIPTHRSAIQPLQNLSLETLLSRIERWVRLGSVLEGSELGGWGALAHRMQEIIWPGACPSSCPSSVGVSSTGSALPATT